MSYKGLVVGGPLAGEWLSCDTPDFSTWGPGGKDVRLEDGSVLHMDFPPTDVTYHHVKAGSAGEFWVPAGKTAGWAMQELVRNYRQRQHSSQE